MKRSLAAAALILVAILTAGCAATSAPGAAGVNVEPASRNEESAPRAVTQSEYEAAYARFEECMRASDAPIFAVETIGSVHYYSYLTDRQAEYTKCYAPFESVDIPWQLANEYDNPTQVALRGCLEAIGVVPEKSVDGVWEQIQSSKIDPVACATR